MSSSQWICEQARFFIGLLTIRDWLLANLISLSRSLHRQQVCFYLCLHAVCYVSMISHYHAFFPRGIQCDDWFSSNNEPVSAGHSEGTRHISRKYSSTQSTARKTLVDSHFRLRARLCPFSTLQRSVSSLVILPNGLDRIIDKPMKVKLEHAFEATLVFIQFRLGKFRLGLAFCKEGAFLALLLSQTNTCITHWWCEPRDAALVCSQPFSFPFRQSIFDPR